MKRKGFLVLALVLAIGLVSVGCDNGSTGSGREPVVYSGTSGNATYTLTITPPESRAALAGDIYELVIVQAGVTKKSSGKVANASGNTFNLQPAVPNSPPFTVTTGTVGITAITGNITLENGTVETAPTTVSPSHSHTWGEWTTTTAATCTTAGVETRVCTQDASHTETRNIAALGHNWGAWEVTTPATATQAGVETRTCTRDPSHTETRAIPATGGGATISGTYHLQDSSWTMSVTFGSNGTVTINDNGETLSGTYTVSGDTITVNFPASGGTGTWTIVDSNTIRDEHGVWRK
jgi:hypothetical protein